MLWWSEDEISPQVQVLINLWRGAGTLWVGVLWKEGKQFPLPCAPSIKYHLATATTKQTKWPWAENGKTQAVSSFNLTTLGVSYSDGKLTNTQACNFYFCFYTYVYVLAVFVVVLFCGVWDWSQSLRHAWMLCRWTIAKALFTIFFKWILERSNEKHVANLL